MTTDTDTPTDARSTEELLNDPEWEIRWLGRLEGIGTTEHIDESEGAILFLHGDERSCAVMIDDTQFCTQLARAGVEIEAAADAAEEEPYGAD